jgi:hypothetical protein
MLRPDSMRAAACRAVLLIALFAFVPAAIAAGGSSAARTSVAHERRPASARRLGHGVAASRADCAYTANSITELTRFEKLVGHTFTCAMVFSNANPNWTTWEQPWFLSDLRPEYEWGVWAKAPRTHRQLVITISPFPSSLDGTDWLAAGASGAFDGHARSLAENLVAAGLGRSVIRLAPEANDTGDAYSIGTTRTQLERWRRMWRREVLAMRAVRGAHFMFDWCVNARWRAIPLAEWYPGNDVVNIIGVDSYDSGVPLGEPRWSTIMDASGGLADVIAFARAHDKPISLPEWGLDSPGAEYLGGGDDPTYVNGIAALVRANTVAYQSYFFNENSAAVLRSSPRALAAYRRAFGAGGDSVGAPTITGWGARLLLPARPRAPRRRRPPARRDRRR